MNDERQRLFAAIVRTQFARSSINSRKGSTAEVEANPSAHGQDRSVNRSDCLLHTSPSDADGALRRSRLGPVRGNPNWSPLRGYPRLSDFVSIARDVKGSRSHLLRTSRGRLRSH
jgi:hypothetical protein